MPAIVKQTYIGRVSTFIKLRYLIVLPESFVYKVVQGKFEGAGLDLFGKHYRDELILEQWNVVCL